MKRLTVLSTVILMVLAIPLLGQVKIAYIDSDRIRAEYDEFAEAQAEFDKMVREWETEAESLKSELMSLQEEYENQALLLSDEKRQELEMRIQDKRMEYEDFLARIFSENGLAQKKNAELTKPLLEKINNELYELAEDEHLDVILDIAGGGVAYARPELEITDQLIERLNK